MVPIEAAAALLSMAADAVMVAGAVLAATVAVHAVKFMARAVVGGSSRQRQVHDGIDAYNASSEEWAAYLAKYEKSEDALWAEEARMADAGESFSGRWEDLPAGPDSEPHGEWVHPDDRHDGYGHADSEWGHADFADTMPMAR